MIRRDFLKKLAIGGGVAATLPLAGRSGAEGESGEEERTRFLAQLAEQVADTKKQLAQLEKSHKLLFKTVLVALSLSVGVDLASIL